MRNLLLTLCVAFLPMVLTAQSSAKDLTTARSSTERKAILAALRPKLSKEAGVPVSFVVEHLKVQGGWAFLRGVTKTATGGDVRWDRSPECAEVVKNGLFDGGATAALLKRVRGRWTSVVHIVGPTDVSWACWWKEYRAPRAIFDLAEDCR